METPCTFGSLQTLKSPLTHIHTHNFENNNNTLIITKNGFTKFSRKKGLEFYDRRAAAHVRPVP